MSKVQVKTFLLLWAQGHVAQGVGMKVAHRVEYPSAETDSKYSLVEVVLGCDSTGTSFQKSYKNVCFVMVRKLAHVAK